MEVVIEEKIKISENRISDVRVCSKYSHLLISNIESEHCEKYMKNEKIWIDFLIESIKNNDFILPVVMYGNFSSYYQEARDIFLKIENGEIKTREFGKEEIKLIECYSRFSLLCEIVGGFADFNQLSKEIIRYKKRAFFSLKEGDSVLIKTQNVLKRYRYGTPKISEKEIKTDIISVSNKKGGFKVQVRYGNRWFSEYDYPYIIRTGDNGWQFGGSEEIYNVENGMDKLFEILK